MTTFSDETLEPDNARKTVQPVAWVTGASSGIGRAVSLTLAKRGWHVIASARNTDALEVLEKELEESTGGDESGGCIIPLTMDVSNDFMDMVIAANGTTLFKDLSLCVVCAGHCEYVDDVVEQDIALYERVFQTNFLGAVRTAVAAIPFLRNTASGGNRTQMVFITSLSNMVGFSRAEAYGSSKAAIEYYANSLRIDAHPLGIDVSVVSPGFVKTPMTDKNDFSMPFIMSSEQAAQRIVNAIEKRPRLYRFPKRLSWLLTLFSMIPSLWYSRIGPALRNRQAE